MLLCLALALVTSCSDPQSPPVTEGESTFQGLYDTSGELTFRIESENGTTSALRLVASDLSYDSTERQLHAQVAIRNTGTRTLPGPTAVQIDQIDPDWVEPVNALPMRCPTPERCLGTWEFIHEGTYGGDAMLAPGETSSPIEWVFADSTGESFSFRASLRPGDASQPGVISGFVFADANGDGERQPSESGIAAVAVSLLHGDSTTTMSTASDGAFAFHVEEPGLYEVVRESDIDCDPTTPTRLQVFLVRQPDGTLSGYSGLMFGCRRALPGAGILVIGIVFEDQNRDGIHQPGEPGLAGVQLTATGTCPTFAPVRTRTDANGRYSLRLVDCPPPAVITRERLPGFVDTSPNPVVLTWSDPVPPDSVPAPGSAARLTLRANFGVAAVDPNQTSSVEGFVFEDTNLNGLREEDEPGIAGVEVTASGLLCESPVIGITHTDSSGYYVLSEADVHCVLPWRVAHDPVDGLCDTSRNPVEVGWDRMVDPRHYRVDFGMATCDVPPDQGLLVVFVFWDAQGLPGRRLEIVELGQVQFTNDAGLARFSLPPGNYTLHADVNGPGPPIGEDLQVTIRRGQTTRIDVLDCLPCVASQ
jgi:hypothetical protein